MTNFEQEKTVLIANIEQQENELNNLIEMNQSINLFNQEQLDQLQEISDKNKKYLHKLKSDEFEIAIVGLEKAGKSTFANALIGNNVLPSAPERCTFTSTRLVSGKDQAIAQYYQKEEFNQKFQELLKEIEHPEAETANFETFSADAFEKYFTELEEKKPALYKSHIGKTDEEIKDILKYRKNLILNGLEIKFTGDELTTDKFQAYIKGEKNNNGVNTAKPRSVKFLEIQSSKLVEMPTAIIYDVPGFDSPTKIHMQQTEERLKSADAIILVTNVGRNPSIQGTSLSVITKNTDEDGIALRDKLFVFGNQLDTANSLEQAKGNIDILKKDVERLKIGRAERVFAGSALKHLTDIDRSTDVYNAKYEIEANVTQIRESIQQYYETERFQILKRKISQNHTALKTFFKDFINQYESDESNSLLGDIDRVDLAINEYSEIINRLEDMLTDKLQEIKKEVYESKYFSNDFQSKIKAPINSLEYFKEIEMEDLDKTFRKTHKSITLELPINKINSTIREKLYEQFLKEFTDLIKSMTNEKASKIEFSILDVFIKAIIGENSAYLNNALEDKSRHLISKITGHIAHNPDRFDYLAERFSRNLFDLMILYPRADDDRKAKFFAAQQEFIFLDGYYNKNDGALINLALSQNNEPLMNNNELKETVKELLRKIPDAAHVFSKDPIIKTALTTLDILLEKMDKKQSYRFEKIESEEEYEKIFKKEESKTREDLLTEINTDINNLKDILQKAVIPAMNLELAFVNSIDKQIKLILESLRSETTENSKTFRKYASYIISKFKENEFNHINQSIESKKLKEEFLEKIKSFTLTL